MKALVVALAMLAVPALSMAQTQPNPRWTLTGPADIVLPAGQPDTGNPVNLALSAQLNTDGAAISGWQHALIAPAGWSFQGMSVGAAGFTGGVTAAGVASGDVVFAGPQLGGELSVFAFSGADRGPYDGAANPATETWNVMSNTKLTPGSYTFTIGDSGAGFFMANAGAPDGIPFGASTGYTLKVIATQVPEPASALLLLAGLPFMRRRRVA